MRPVTRQRRTSPAAGWLASLALVLPVALAQQADPGKTERELAAVQAEIERVRVQVSRDQVERNRLARELRAAELSVGEARAALERLRTERAEHTLRRARLAEQRRDQQHALERGRDALAGEVRAAYIVGREEPLRLLLNQKEPALAGRMLTYYGYFGRARASRLRAIEANVQRIEELDRELVEQERRLEALEAERQSELARLDDARRRRGSVLASLTTEAETRAAGLERLRRQKSGLEKLLRELRRAMEKFPVAGKDAFAKLRGQLAWPVAGKLVARFGEARAGGMRWDGMLVATERGAPVRSVYHGRVVYADWLPGLGLLAVVDHGEGYLSLYGHNERLYKAAGERVTAGDTLAAAGDSGGRSRPELYFEIRKAGKPVDPRPWFKAEKPRP